MSTSSTISTVNRRDLDFQLFEVLNVERLVERSYYNEHDRTSFTATLDLAQDLAAREFQTHYRESDLQEPVVVEGKVRVLPQIKTALNAFAEAGFMNADRPFEEGGQQLPFSVFQACLACFQAANIGTSSYNFLTISGAGVIREFGSEDQKRLFMQPMLESRYLGTMCLSEPQSGSALSGIRTKATPQADGSYKIKGSKMWISAGEHELSENIVHLVLARIEGAPEGTKGISLFIVPRLRVDQEGNIGESNGVSLIGLNHKMGYRGTVNTLLSFGEDSECIGHLVGEPNQGLSYMFHMMNEARISVGVGAAMLGTAGYLYSLEYARTRVQGFLPGPRDPSSSQVPLIEHADIRRMLLAQKSSTEGAFALCLYAAVLVDDARTASDEEARRKAESLLEILTPIVKSWPSENCLEANKLAMQVLGGYGYTRDYPVEQYYRDNRLNLIHEGTHGIQALDLVNRKIRMNDGALLKLLLDTVAEDIDAAKGGSQLTGFVSVLENALQGVRTATSAMGLAPNDRVYTANATLYLDMLGHVVIGWMWLRQARIASAALERGEVGQDKAFYAGKLAACRYFYTYEMPRLSQWLPILSSADSQLVDLLNDWL